MTPTCIDQLKKIHLLPITKEHNIQGVHRCSLTACNRKYSLKNLKVAMRLCERKRKNLLKECQRTFSDKLSVYMHILAKHTAFGHPQ